MAAKFKGLQ